jgi:hypothetical protein
MSRAHRHGLAGIVIATERFHREVFAMKLLLALLGAMVLAVGVADAAPRDLVAVTGTISHETRDQFMVLRGDDGRTYHIDLSRADRSPQTRNLSSNQKVGVIGAQGGRNDEIRAYIIDVFDNKPTVAQGYTDTPGTAFQRVHGVVESVAPNVARVRIDDGRTINVNISEMDRKDALRQGERVTMVGRVEGGMYRAFWARAREDGDVFTTDRDEPGRWRRLHGTVESRDGNRMRFRADGGRVWDVDISGVPQNQRSGLERREDVTIAGVIEDGRLMARYIDQADGGQASREPGWQAGLPPRGQEVRIHGQATSFEGRTFRFSSIDGQLMMVDSSNVSDGEHRLLASGQPVTVVGVRRQGDTIVAREVSRDTRHDRRPLGEIDPGVQRVQTLRGRVQSASGDTVQMRTDEGRNVTLDITAVRDRIARQLRPGDEITVTGFYREESRSMFSVRSLREDDNAAASPRLERRLRPDSKDDCRDEGWRKFSDPTFKNQGDCVSWVNQRTK